MAEVTEYLEITDFSPGIHSTYHSSGKAAVLKDGAATIENTNNCHSDESGALVPAPRIVASKTQTLLPEGNSFGGTYGGALGSYVMDAVVAGPMRNVNGTIIREGPDLTPVPDAVMVAHTFLYGDTGANIARYVLWRLYKEWLASPTTADFFFQKSAAIGSSPTPPYPWPLPSMMGEMTIQARNGATGPPFGQADMYPMMAFLPGATTNGLYIANGSGAIGSPQTGYTTFDTDPIGQDGAATSAYPSITPGVWVLGDAFAGGVRYSIRGLASLGLTALLAIHQGRISCWTMHGGAIGQGWGPDEADGLTRLPPRGVLHYQANERVDTAAFNTKLIFDDGSRAGTLVSLSSRDLFIVSTYRGATVLSGDMDNPTLTRLPFVQSTDGVMAAGVATPFGVVYGSRRGVFLWSGGQTSEHLSPQIEGFFWRHELDTTNEVYYWNRGRFEWWHPFVLAPNNFMYDSRTQSWWRLGSIPSTSAYPYHVYRVSPSNPERLYAFRYKLKDTQNTLWDVFDASLRALTYSWQSQPLIRSRDRALRFQDLVLIAQAEPSSTSPSIVVTLTGYSEDGTQVVSRAMTFSLNASNAGRPVHLTQDVKASNNESQGSFRARHVQVRIEASAATGNAPKVYSLKLGVREDTEGPKV